MLAEIADCLDFVELNFVIVIERKMNYLDYYYCLDYVHLMY